MEEESKHKTVTRLQLAMEETRQARESMPDKVISDHDMTESLIKKPTPGKAIMEFCRKCSNYDVGVRYWCWKKDCELWLFRQGGRGALTNAEIAEYKEALKRSHEKTETGAVPCDKLRGGWSKNGVKK